MQKLAVLVAISVFACPLLISKVACADDFDRQLKIDDAQMKVDDAQSEIKKIQKEKSDLASARSKKNRELQKAEDTYRGVRQKIGYKKLEDEDLQTKEERAELKDAKGKIDSIRDELAGLESQQKDINQKLSDARRDLMKSKTALAALQRARSEAGENDDDSDTDAPAQ